MREAIEELLGSSVKIPTLPVMYDRINDAINNPRASLSDIGSIIEKDPSLTARLLKLANSAFYAIPCQFDSITRALVMIGTRELRDFVLGTTILSLFKGIPKDLVNMKSFWEHSIACGLAAKIIATFRGDTNAERLFVAGLLHDVGRLFIYKNMIEKMRDILMRCKATSELLFVVEKNVLGFDHAKIGYVLLDKWNLPENIKETVNCHHHPQRAKSYPVETAIVHVADVLVHSIQIGNNGECFVPPLNAYAWKLTELQISQLSPIFDQMDRQFEEVLQSLFPEQHYA